MKRERRENIGDGMRKGHAERHGLLHSAINALRNHKNQKAKKALIFHGVLVDECQACGLGPEWNGEPLVLQVDHIDGDRNNIELSNIRLLCPNCHSQTGTFARNKGP